MANNNTAVRPLVGVLGGSTSDFPILEKAVAMLNRARDSQRIAGGIRPSNSRSPLCLCGTGIGARYSGHYRRSGRRSPSARNGGGKDLLARNRGSNSY